MVSSFTIRYAKLADAESVLGIYAPFIINTSITFEYTVPTLEEYRTRMQKIMEVYPFLVAERGDEIIGFAYATKFRERAAYQWDIETSVYISEGFQSQGVARQLYSKLLLDCESQGFYNAYAVITLPNDKSIAFHLKAGFSKVGVFSKSGYKKEQWHDVMFLEKQLMVAKGIPNAVKGPSKA